MRTYKRHLIFDETKTAIHWHLSRFCDKHCHYCLTEQTMDRKGKYQVFSDEELLVHENIYQFLLKQTNTKIEFFGGEPIAHPKGVDYFNGLCQNSKDNSNVAIYVLTHGDLTDEIINRINPGGKKECMFIASYHPTQVNLDEWISSIIKIKEKVNLSCVLILPPDEKKWPHLYMVFEKLLDLDLFVATRLLSDTTYHSVLSENLLTYFKPLFERNKNGLIFGFHSNQILETIDGKDNVKSIHEILDGFRPNPNKTFCKTRQFLIDDKSKLGIGCSMRGDNTFQITASTHHSKLQELVDTQHYIKCDRDVCIETNSVSTVTKILDS